MKNILTGKDKILQFFYNLHYNNGLFKSLKRIYVNIFSKAFGEANRQKNIVLKRIYMILCFMLYISLCAVFIPLYVVIYALTAVITFSIVSVEVVALAIFYGLFPFVLKAKSENENSEAVKTNKKGLDKLLYPISWSVNWNKNQIIQLIHFGFAPGRKIKQLSYKNSGSFIIDRISLVLAQIISFVIYVLTVYVSVLLISDVVLFAITILALLLWCVLKLFVEVIFKLFSANADSDLDDEAENNSTESVDGGEE